MCPGGFELLPQVLAVDVGFGSPGIADSHDRRDNGALPRGLVFMFSGAFGRHLGLADSRGRTIIVVYGEALIAGIGVPSPTNVAYGFSRAAPGLQARRPAQRP